MSPRTPFGHVFALATGLTMLLASVSVATAAGIAEDSFRAGTANAGSTSGFWYCAVDYVIDNERTCVVGIGTCHITVENDRPCAYVCVLPNAIAETCHGYHPPRAGSWVTLRP